MYFHPYEPHKKKGLWLDEEEPSSSPEGPAGQAAFLSAYHGARGRWRRAGLSSYAGLSAGTHQRYRFKWNYVGLYGFFYGLIMGL